MSDVVWQALIAALLAVYMEWSRRRTAEKVEQASIKTDLAVTKVEAVKTTLEHVTEAAALAAAERSKKLSDVAAQVDAVATTAEALEKQGNSRWEKLEADLQKALNKIDTLQQQRVDEARGKKPS